MTLVIRDPRVDSDELGYVRRALDDGAIVVVPTDTVYGLAAHADQPEAVAALYALKGRAADQPTAIAFPTIDALHAAIPELSLRARWAIAALLPGPWTLVVRNPAGRWTWLTGGTPGPIGLRVPAGALRLPPVAATSANLAGEPTVREVHELAPGVLEQVACAVDRGPLPPARESTIVDLTAWEVDEGPVRVVRDPGQRAGHVLAMLSGPYLP
ncbi:MAG: L-threonylcarbamoyladenylate synthase [Thermoleophilia bacterium]|nr:L-threonylcarbamoyladenylate synthase [Thermoleophilia bacterium]